MSDYKDALRARAMEYVCPGRVAMLDMFGLDLVIDRREGYRIWDVDGHELIDYHINGGVFSLGHRNPELVDTLRHALDHWDIGNHHFPSIKRGELAERLAECTPGNLQYTVFASGGGEAVDIAIKSARHATGRRAIISIQKGYHGHTGLALQAGDPRFSKLFHSESAEGDFVQVPFNDLEAMRSAFENHAVAAVIIETLPATYGFPLPAPGYLSDVATLCRQHRALYIADEVQTGLGRTGKLWGIECYGVEPDILITGKGLSGGLYPIAATVLTPAAGAWLHEDGWAHVSTFGGAELGCVVAGKVLDIVQRPEVIDNAREVGEVLMSGLESLQRQYAEWFVEIRCLGLVMGLKFNDAMGGMHMSRVLYENGVWAMFAGLDTSVLQFKPGMLLTRQECAETLDRFESALKTCSERFL